MAKYTVYQVDAFSSVKFSGNPAGVVLNADGLTENQMQKMANELNNSETCFLMTPEGSDHDLRVRFFTPSTEIPMCGHNTIALHYVRALEGLATEGRYVQKTKAGLIPIKISKDSNERIIVTMTQSHPTFESLPANFKLSTLTSALGISSDDLNPQLPLEIASTGNRKLMIGLRSKKILHSLKPNQSELFKIGNDLHVLGFYTFVVSENDAEALTHGRLFAPNLGIIEDPVTGMAIGPLGAYLIKNKIVDTRSSHFSFRAKQGEGMGRPGLADVKVDIENGHPLKVDVSGTAVIVFKTEIEV